MMNASQPLEIAAATIIETTPMPIATAQRRGRGERELRFGERQGWRLQLEPTMPAQRGRLRLGGLQFGEEDHVVERPHERRAAILRSATSAANRLRCWIARVNLPLALP